MVSDVVVLIAGKAVDKTSLFDVVVEQELDHPAMAVVLLDNHDVRWSEKITEGDELEVQLGFDGRRAMVFKGEVVALEPLFHTERKMRVAVRAFDKLHRLSRGMRSRTYAGCSDREIVDQICQDYSLSADYGDAPPSTVWDHVYQHNLSDLTFLRERAASIGYSISVEDSTLRFFKRHGGDPEIKLALGGELSMFRPRLSTTEQLSEVRVRAWDPTQKKELIGVAKATSSTLGDKTGTACAGRKHKDVLEVSCDTPLANREQADLLAAALLERRAMAFITGHGAAQGDPRLKPGILVGLAAGDKRFDGKYWLTAVRHRYSHRAGYQLDFRFARDATSEVQTATQTRPASAPPPLPPAPAPPPPPPKPASWVEIKLLGEDGSPVAGESYRLTLPDGEIVEGELDDDGLARVEVEAPGTCRVSFPALDQDAWVPA